MLGFARGGKYDGKADQHQRPPRKSAISSAGREGDLHLTGFAEDAWIVDVDQGQIG